MIINRTYCSHSEFVAFNMTKSDIAKSKHVNITCVVLRSMKNGSSDIQVDRTLVIIFITILRLKLYVQNSTILSQRGITALNLYERIRFFFRTTKKSNIILKKTKKIL